MTDAVYTLKVNLPVAKIEETLAGVAKERGYGLLGTRDLTALLREKGQEPKGEYRVYDICKPPHAAKVLGTNAGIASVLPCRISATSDFGDEASCTLTFMRPTMMLEVFNTPELDDIAEEVDADMVAMCEAIAAAE